MPRIAINTRVLSCRVTGVQRYTAELLARWKEDAWPIAPPSSWHGLTGHLWEQAVLPGRLQGCLLFSPSNTGPLAVGNQVVTMHDMAVFDCPNTFSVQFGAWYRMLLPRLAQRTRRIITVSAFVKERILAHTHVDPDKISVIPNGVSPRFQPAAAPGCGATVAALGLPSHEYILTVGSAEPRKNLNRLLQAWNRVQNRVSGNIWLVVVGADNPRVFRNRRLKSLPARVFFLGHVEDDVLPALYAGALAMAYVSLYEGFGLPTLEAMASGTAVLAGNRSSLPEVVGSAGLLVDPFDVKAIADGMERILEDSALRSDLRQRGLARANQFSWDQTARSTWDLLKAAAEGD